MSQSKNDQMLGLTHIVTHIVKQTANARTDLDDLF